MVNRVLGSSSVSYGKTSFQTKLHQKGTNKATSDVLYGYFPGYAHFSQREIDTAFYYGGKTIGLSSATISGRTIQYLGWQ